MPAIPDGWIEDAPCAWSRRVVFSGGWVGWLVVWRIDGRFKASDDPTMRDTLAEACAAAELAFCGCRARPVAAG